MEAGEHEALEELAKQGAAIEAALRCESKALNILVVDAGVKLMDDIAKPLTRRVDQFFSQMVAFLEEAESELPHGQRPCKHRNDKMGRVNKDGTLNQNSAKRLLSDVRSAHLHEARGRVGCLAGWEMSSRKVVSELATDKGADSTDEFTTDGYRHPTVFWPTSIHVSYQPAPGNRMLLPQVVTCNGALLAVVSFFERGTRDRKARVAYKPAAAKDVRKLIVAHPETSVGSTFYFTSASQMRHLALKDSVILVELDAKLTPSDRGWRVDLTTAAYALFTELAEHSISELVAKLEKRLDVDAAKKLASNLIRSSPIKFIHGFTFNAHSFLQKPTTPTGMAQARTGMQFVTARRAQILKLGEEASTLEDRLLQVVPIFFEDTFLRKAPSKKLEDYSRRAYERLEACIAEFTKKKLDSKYRAMLTDLREIADASK